tara:strand:+ start:911 stop:1264 length:354 start_codon:yes stop_codon:yes gene_type:complete
MASNWVSFRVENEVFNITKILLRDTVPNSLLYKLATSTMIIDKDPNGAILLEVPLDIFIIIYRTILDNMSDAYIISSHLIIDRNKFMNHTKHYMRMDRVFKYLGLETPGFVTRHMTF